MNWDGITQRASIKDWVVQQRDDLADAARQGTWPRVLELVGQRDELANVARLEGKSGYAPLHQAAWHGAPLEVVRQLIELGAARTLTTTEGQRPLDIARERGHAHLLDILTPVLRHDFDADALAAIETHFHAVIRGRSPELIAKQALRLPVLSVLLELDEPKLWFPVPGMYGGYSFWLEPSADPPRLVSESWCRVAGGSGQRHEITAEGSKLTAEGFV